MEQEKKLKARARGRTEVTARGLGNRQVQEKIRARAEH